MGNVLGERFDLWYLLHHAESEDDLVLGLTCYLDDSGSDDNSPITVIGGTALTRLNFKAFSERWRKALRYHRITQPLHLTDFKKPYGIHSGMAREMQIALFDDVTKLILDHYTFSLSISVVQSDFIRLIPDGEVRKHVATPITFAFFAAIVVNRAMAKNHNLQRIAYLADEGSRLYTDQFVDAHGAAVKAEMGKQPHYTGALTFAKDDNVPALQAADVIAGIARMDQGGIVPEGLEPLRQLLSTPSHVRLKLGLPAIARLATPIYNWLVKHGTPPTLQDIITA